MRRHRIAHGRIGRLPATLEFVESEFLDDELHASLVSILAVAQGVEYLNHRFDGRQQFVHRRKFSQHLRHARCRSQATTGHHPEANGSIRPFRREQADVVNGCEGAILPAARQRDLEFPRETLVQRITQQMVGNCFRVGRHIEHFALAHSGQMARRHITHRVGAGFTCGQSHCRQLAHHLRHVLKLHEMQLNVLTRRDMAHAGGKLVGQFSHASQLIGRQTAEWNFDPEHLHAGLPLTIDAVLQAEGLEDVGREIAGQHTLSFGLECLDFFDNMGRNGLSLHSGAKSLCMTTYHNDLVGSEVMCRASCGSSNVIHQCMLLVEGPLALCQLLDRHFG